MEIFCVRGVLVVCPTRTETSFLIEKIVIYGIVTEQKC